MNDHAGADQITQTLKTLFCAIVQHLKKISLGKGCC